MQVTVPYVRQLISYGAHGTGVATKNTLAHLRLMIAERPYDTALIAAADALQQYDCIDRLRDRCAKPHPSSTALAVNHLAQAMHTQCLRDGRLVTPAHSADHAMLLEILVPPGEQRATVRLFDSSSGYASMAPKKVPLSPRALLQQSRLSREMRKKLHCNKICPVLEICDVPIRGAGARLDAKAFAALLYCGLAPSGQDNRNAVYEWVLTRGRLSTDAPQRLQAEQNTDNCEHKCLMAFLAHRLGIQAYCEVRMKLLERAWEHFSLAVLHPFVAARLWAKILRARRKLAHCTSPEQVDEALCGSLSPRRIQWMEWVEELNELPTRAMNCVGLTLPAVYFCSWSAASYIAAGAFVAPTLLQYFSIRALQRRPMVRQSPHVLK